MAKHRNYGIEDYRSLMDETTVLVDVRETEEVRSGMLPGAVHIPLGQLKARMEEVAGSKRVAVYCRSGKRSVRAARLFTSRGFEDVVNLEGGVLALVAARQGESVPPEQDG